MDDTDGMLPSQFGGPEASRYGQDVARIGRLGHRDTAGCSLGRSALSQVIQMMDVALRCNFQGS